MVVKENGLCSEVKGAIHNELHLTSARSMKFIPRREHQKSWWKDLSGIRLLIKCVDASLRSIKGIEV